MTISSVMRVLDLSMYISAKGVKYDWLFVFSMSINLSNIIIASLYLTDSNMDMASSKYLLRSILDATAVFAGAGSTDANILQGRHPSAINTAVINDIQNNPLYLFIHALCFFSSIFFFFFFLFFESGYGYLLPVLFPERNLLLAYAQDSKIACCIAFLNGITLAGILVFYD